MLVVKLFLSLNLQSKFSFSLRSSRAYNERLWPHVWRRHCVTVSVCDRTSINHVIEQFVTDELDHPRHTAAKQTRRQMTQMLLIRHGSVNRRHAICFDERVMSSRFTIKRRALIDVLYVLFVLFQLPLFRC